MTIGTINARRQRNEGRWLLAGLLMATTAMATIPEVKAQSLDPLSNGYGVALSNDGRYFVFNSAGGRSWNGFYGSPDGVINLGNLGVDYTEAAAISANGETVVGGSSLVVNESRAFRWRAATGMQDLGSLAPGANAWSMAHGVSADGRRIIGQSIRPGQSAYDHGFVWVEGATGGVAHNPQMFQLQSGNGDNASAVAISDDGNFIAGSSYTSSRVYTAMRWDITDIETNGLPASGQSLGTLGGSGAKSAAISADGRAIVGTSRDVDGRDVSFLWREGSTGGVSGNEEMQSLGTLGGNWSNAFGISSGGDYVVGASGDDYNFSVAYRWDENRGMVAVADLLDEAGVEVGSLSLHEARDVSTDGNVIIGTMYDGPDQVAYLARLDNSGAGGEGGGNEDPNGGGGNEQPNGGGGGLMKVSEYQQTLYAGAGGIASAGEFLSWLPMNGAHHRPLMLTPELDGDMCAWATGDFAHHGGTSMGIGLAEVGACTDLAGGAVRIGGAVGTTRSWQDLALGGSSRMAGQYVLGEVDWQPDGTPLLLSVTGMLGGWQANVDRAYSNGANTATSSGQTNAMGGVVRLRADWLDAATLGNTTINPWTSVSVGALHVDGYTESGGPFPARFNAQDLSHVDVRLGLTAITEISTQTKLSTTFEVAHRTGSAPTASGQVNGLFAFSVGGGQQSNTWLRVGAELDHKINESLSLSGSVHFATAGRDPSVAGSIGLKGAF